jgi:hypothetical protein
VYFTRHEDGNFNVRLQLLSRKSAPTVMTLHSIALGLAILAGLGLIYALLVALFSPLRRVPGPVAARFTNLFYLNRVRYGHFHYENKTLHHKYGPVVRLGEDLVSIDDPSALKTIYGSNSLPLFPPPSLSVFLLLLLLFLFGWTRASCSVTSIMSWRCPEVEAGSSLRNLNSRIEVSQE